MDIKEMSSIMGLLDLFRELDNVDPEHRMNLFYLARRVGFEPPKNYAECDQRGTATAMFRKECGIPPTSMNLMNLSRQDFARRVGGPVTNEHLIFAPDACEVNRMQQQCPIGILIRQLGEMAEIRDLALDAYKQGYAFEWGVRPDGAQFFRVGGLVREPMSRTPLVTRRDGSVIISNDK